MRFGEAGCVRIVPLRIFGFPARCLGLQSLVKEPKAEHREAWILKRRFLQTLPEQLQGKFKENENSFIGQQSVSRLDCLGLKSIRVGACNRICVGCDIEKKQVRSSKGGRTRKLPRSCGSKRFKWQWCCDFLFRFVRQPVWRGCDCVDASDGAIWFPFSSSREDNKYCPYTTICNWNSATCIRCQDSGGNVAHQLHRFVDSSDTWRRTNYWSRKRGCYGALNRWNCETCSGLSSGCDGSGNRERPRDIPAPAILPSKRYTASTTDVWNWHRKPLWSRCTALPIYHQRPMDIGEPYLAGCFSHCPW